MISVIIPTFNNPEVLDLCLESLVTGQQSKNQIIVVVDGDYEISKSVLEKYYFCNIYIFFIFIFNIFFLLFTFSIFKYL